MPDPGGRRVRIEHRGVLVADTGPFKGVPGSMGWCGHPAPGLHDWREAPRVRALNDHTPDTGGRFVLCWLQQALRGHDNPLIDAGIRLGNALGLPSLVYHGVREDYPLSAFRHAGPPRGDLSRR